MAVTRAARDAEIKRLRRGGFRLHATTLKDSGAVFDLLVLDNRRPRHNEAMSQVNADAKIARVTVRPGKWTRYEPGSGGASAYPRSDLVFTAPTGGGCTTF